LVAKGIQPLAVEPNLKKHESLCLAPWQEAAQQADLVVYLVAHREFDNLVVQGQVLDFCGVTQV
jgi:UDP-N-acetyl-D-mannosaminuronic acid dehydrogenase